MPPKRAREAGAAPSKPSKSAKAPKAEPALPDIEDWAPGELQQASRCAGRTGSAWGPNAQRRRRAGWARTPRRRCPPVRWRRHLAYTSLPLLHPALPPDPSQPAGLVRCQPPHPVSAVHQQPGAAPRKPRLPPRMRPHLAPPRTDEPCSPRARRAWCRPWRRNPHSKLSAAAVEAAAAEGQTPAPADLPGNEFIYYVWVCEIMSQQVRLAAAGQQGSLFILASTRLPGWQQGLGLVALAPGDSQPRQGARDTPLPPPAPPAQTQVSRAAEYFRRWVARWPTVQALAGATQEEVNELWAGERAGGGPTEVPGLRPAAVVGLPDRACSCRQRGATRSSCHLGPHPGSTHLPAHLPACCCAGLGYYRRARYLLDGAKYIVGECGGAFPTTAKELQAIPGAARGLLGRGRERQHLQPASLMAPSAARHARGAVGPLARLPAPASLTITACSCNHGLLPPPVILCLAAPAGVGAYTSAAIASIACGERAAVVDGNVIRVLARLRRVAGDPRSGAHLRGSFLGLVGAPLCGLMHTRRLL